MKYFLVTFLVNGKHKGGTLFGETDKCVNDALFVYLTMGYDAHIIFQKQITEDDFNRLHNFI